MVRYPLLRGEASAYRPNFGAICTGSSSKLLTSTVLRISVHLFAFIFCYIHLHWHPCAFSLLTSGMSEFYIHPGLPVDHSAFHLLFSSLLFSSDCRPRQDSKFVVLSRVQVDHPLLVLRFPSLLSVSHCSNCVSVSSAISCTDLLFSSRRRTAGAQ